MKTSDSINEIAAALAKAQAEMTVAVFDSKNPHYKSIYASLSAVTAAVRGPLTKHGIAFIQSCDTTPDTVQVFTRLVHSSGQWIETAGPVIPIGKGDAHGAMSATTYGRRGSLAVALSLPSDEDDDGNAAVQQAPALADPNAIADLVERLLVLGKKPADFAKFMGVSAIEKLPASKLEAARAAITAAERKAVAA